jgi:hypothetical protein
MLGLHSLVELANLTADTALTSPDPPPIDPRIADRFLFTVRQYGPGDFASSTDAPPEYLAYQRSQWWNSHRNAPALFVQANEIPGLWTDCQRSLIERYWPAGWQSDPSAPIMKLTGAMRPSSAHHREGAASEKVSVIISYLCCGFTGFVR